MREEKLTPQGEIDFSKKCFDGVLSRSNKRQNKLNSLLSEVASERSKILGERG